MTYARPEGDPPGLPDVRSAYRQHGAELFGFAVNELGDRGVAEELVQEVFVRAWRAGDRFDPSRGSVRTWLYAIARNLVIDARRARSARPPLVADDSRPERADPDDFTRRVEQRVQIADGLAALSDDHREVIQRVHVEGLTYAELSERTGVPAATLRTRAFHAMRALRTTMTHGGWTR